MLMQIAVYGKGGIGKSTLAANISAALAMAGKQVLQIGCDPKHDSTRLLTHGVAIPTVLDYMRTTGPADYRLDDVLFSGFEGIGCVEAGGPKPGVGCAGRGIITAFEMLDQFHVKDRYDMVVYDVLGDVVCGGFAVPIRREYADVIFVVTSGEYMSIYAANNILRGISNYDGANRRVAGILYNARGLADEDRRVEAFANAAHLPIVARIPRSPAFANAERSKRTVVELGQDEGVCGIFHGIAAQIAGDLPLFEACPMADDELEHVVLGTEEVPSDADAFASQATAGSASPAPAKAACAPSPADAPAEPAHADAPAEPAHVDASRLMSKNLVRNEPLHGCAFIGGLTEAVHLQDAVVLAHAPKSCAYLAYMSVSSSGRRRLYERGSLMPVSISPNFACDDMGQAEMVFGGMDKLSNAVKSIEARPAPPRAIVVISACTAGIIGDDIDQVRALSLPKLPVVTIKADGNLSGDYLQGMLLAYDALARQVIEPGLPVRPNTCNIVFEKVVAKNTDDNFRVMSGLLSQLGVNVNCRFLSETTYDRLREFCTAPLNLLAYRDYTGKMLQRFFEDEYGCTFFDRGFPVGFDETAEWLAGVAGFYGRPGLAEPIVSKARTEYDARIAALRPLLAGKRLMVVTFNHEIDWVLQAALDCGMEIVKVGILEFSQDEGFRSKIRQPLPVEEGYDGSNRAADIERYRPDILLSNYENSVGNSKCVMDTIPMCPDVGFFSGVEAAERWAGLFDLGYQGEWKDDAGLFGRYYS